MNDLSTGMAILDRNLTREDIQALSGAQTLVGCDLEEADLARLDLSGWEFEQCNLRRADLAGAKLDRTR